MKTKSTSEQKSTVKPRTFGFDAGAYTRGLGSESSLQAYIENAIVQQQNRLPGLYIRSITKKRNELVSRQTVSQIWVKNLTSSNSLMVSKWCGGAASMIIFSKQACEETPSPFLYSIK